MKLCLRWPLAAWLLTACFPIGAIPASDPPAEPILRIEAGQHTNSVRAIDVDAVGQIVVTASDDKTIRLWDLQTQTLLQVLRPPIGPGNRGEMRAVAISPDGRTVIAGGWTRGPSPEEDHALYFFNTTSGEIEGIIGDLPNTVSHLSWSPNGSIIAVGLSYEGIRLLTGAKHSELMRDEEYEDQVYGVAFLPSGGFVTSCLDGKLRLYDSSFHLRKRLTINGGMPVGAHASPDGRYLAVTFHDRTTVELYDAATLKHAGAAEVMASRGDLCSAVFSRDGARLIAGGMYDNGYGHPLVFWDFANPAQVANPREVIASRETIYGIVPLPDGRVVFSSGDPSWGIASVDSGPVTAGTPIADLRGSYLEFRASPDGRQFVFGYTYGGMGGANPADFNVATRALTLGLNNSSTLRRSIESGSGRVQIDNWEGNPAPTRNGKPIPLSPHEVANCYAIGPDNSSFVLGCEWSLRFFDREGTEKWMASAPAGTLAVNITANGKLVLASYSDGTIRWHRATDGRELLAFFPHADKKRWILWTPMGYYDCSPGGEDLIGWHINRGSSAAADFFPASQFRDVFYRPDVIQRILDTSDEIAALNDANNAAGKSGISSAAALLKLPPVVRIGAPAHGTIVAEDKAQVRFRVRTPPGAPVKKVWATIDGAPVAGAEMIPAEAGGELVSTLEVALPGHDCQLALHAENENGKSTPAIVKIKCPATPAAAAPAAKTD